MNNKEEKNFEIVKGKVYQYFQEDGGYYGDPIDIYYNLFGGEFYYRGEKVKDTCTEDDYYNAVDEFYEGYGKISEDGTYVYIFAGKLQLRYKLYTKEEAIKLGYKE